MPFSIPDKGEGLNDIQSIWFQEYIDILVAGISFATCVTSGCAVTAQATPDGTVAIASGTVRSNNIAYTIAGANGTITAADATNPRLDLVVITSAGAIAVRGGVAAVAPKPAVRVAHDVVLAVVFVPAADAAIESAQIVDLRVLAPEVSTFIKGVFYKVDPATVAFAKTGAGTASIKDGTRVEVGGTPVTFATATAITMPALALGTDYAIWVKDDATIQATTNFTTAPAAGNWRKIGGFHYAPGGNAVARSGGDTTPAINAYSFWDLKFKPACPDPRGMALVADGFWVDIYLLGVDHLINGSSKYNVTIADGSSPPKIPTKFGGDGTTAYGSLNWWEATEVLAHHGKRPPSYSEFAALAFGTTEAVSSGGTDVPTTGVTGTGATSGWNIFTSKWGAIQASGNLWQWADEFGGGAAAAAWAANTVSRGSTYQMENAAIFGGSWGETSDSGSRCSHWGNSPTLSSNNVGSRGVCDLLILE